MKKFIILLIFILLSSCSEDEGIKDATLIDKDIIMELPGFEGFQIEYNEYVPDKELITKIKTLYREGEHKFLFYLKLECSCTQDNKTLPILMKTLDEAEISDNDLEFYNTGDKAAKHPHIDIIELEDLPEFYIVIANDPINILKQNLDDRRIENVIATIMEQN